MAGNGENPLQSDDPLLSQAIVEDVIEEFVVCTPQKKLPVQYTVKIVKKNGIETQVFECGICKRDFRYQYALFKHFPSHTENKIFQCDVCKKSFRQASTLLQHKAIHSEERPFACNLCPKSFNRVSTLISHKKTHSTDKAFKCPVCQHGFHQKGNLRNHVYIHTNERPYRCPYCPKGFNQMSNLSCHKLKVHCQEQGIDFNCKLCNLRFLKKSQLKSHNVEYHKAPKDSVKKSAKNPHVASKSTTISHAFPFEKSIVIPYVDTDAMRKVKAKNEMAFGLLMNQEESILVVIFDFGEKSIIREATKEDTTNLSRLPIVALIDVKDGVYTVTTPSRNFLDRMSISDGKITMIKDEKDVGNNAFFGTTGGDDEGLQAERYIPPTADNNSFSSLIEAINDDGLCPNVPNMVKFFTESSPAKQDTIKWEKIDETSFDP